MTDRSRPHHDAATSSISAGDSVGTIAAEDSDPVDIRDLLATLPIELHPSVPHGENMLREEFAGVFNRETIHRVLSESLLAFPDATITSFLPLFMERFTRQQLRALARLEGMISADKPLILFVCVQNTARSQMAAGWLKHLAGDHVEVLSGGSDPAGEVNRAAVEAMAEVGIDITEEFPKPWTEEVIQAASVIVTISCGDSCPLYPGTRYLDWDVADPAGLPLSAVRLIRDEIGRRVSALLEDLVSVTSQTGAHR